MYVHTLSLSSRWYTSMWMWVFLFRFGSFEIFKTRDRVTGRVGPSVGRVDILHQLLDFLSDVFPISSNYVYHYQKCIFTIFCAIFTNTSPANVSLLWLVSSIVYIYISIYTNMTLCWWVCPCHPFIERLYQISGTQYMLSYSHISSTNLLE